MRAYRGKSGKTCCAKNGSGRRNGRRGHGRLAIIGIGPGAADLMSGRAEKLLRESDPIVGYKTYIKLLGKTVEDKKIVAFGMKEERRRALFSIAQARRGRKVALISSGDPGVYGMASLVLELVTRQDLRKMKIEIVPGIIAATACAALTGAPLGHDFAVISLSDLLTDLKLIKRRIKLAAQADLVTVLYNVKSAKRVRPLEEAWKLLMKYKPADTPVSLVRNAAREGEETRLTTLKDMLSAQELDMVSTIIVGNSQSYIKNNYMITPRGYS